MKRRPSGVAALANVALAASVTAIAALTLLPLETRNDVRLRPFTDIGAAVLGPDTGLLAESIANVLLFVPLGAALRLRGLTRGLTALLGLLTSVVVELAQLLVVSGRTTSVDDLLLNTVGAVVGHALLSRWWSETNEPRERRGDSPPQGSIAATGDDEGSPGEADESPEEEQRHDAAEEVAHGRRGGRTAGAVTGNQEDVEDDGRAERDDRP